MVKSAVIPRGVARALEGLDPFHRDVIAALLQGEEERADDALAERHGATLREVRIARILARQRLEELLARHRGSEG